MGTARRAYDLLRGYVNREYDRIRGVDLDDAERELNDSMQGYMPPKKASSTPSPSSTSQPTPQVDPAQIAATREERARRILGVGPEATFDDIRRAFERLSKRGDPNRFPNNSVEREHAATIQKSVQWAYGVLTANIDSVEKRFRSLEIE
ncbi:MAG TPA: J domain-containing protein [Fimbriimonadaceae bacterium]|nr:J domain-containing protein [Fimbriimonadaceae bacterium]